MGRAIDIVQPPDIGLSPIVDMDAHQTIVTAAAGGEDQRRDAEEGSLVLWSKQMVARREH